MRKWVCGVFLLISVVGFTTAEPVQNSPPELKTDRRMHGDTGPLDYETALRPAVLQKRSIANIARLLLGGNVPPNHPLVKYPEPKTWNLASNIVAALPGAVAAASSQSPGWSPPSNALQNIQQLFETKAKIIPYTGQVATGLTGLASVKGDLLRQIHSISTQAIAQAAAEAAARALAGAAAAHAVTNSIAHTVNGGPGAQTGIKGGWSSYSSYQNVYANPPGGNSPGDKPGPPYSASAHINHYQAPPSFNTNPYSVPVTTPSPGVAPTLPSSIAYQTQVSIAAQNQYLQQQQQQLQQQQQQQQQQQSNLNNGYYTLYNTQPATSAHLSQPQYTPSYTPAPPGAPARPTLSPSTLIATTPSGYSPSLSRESLELDPYSSSSSSAAAAARNKKKKSSRSRSSNRHFTSSSNNDPLSSFRRAVPAGLFGRSASQPASPPSILSTISSLLAASTAAYNAAFAGNSPADAKPAALFPNLLSSATSAAAAYNPSPISAPSVLAGTGGAQQANYYNNNGGLFRQPVNPVSQGGGNYGGAASGISPNFLHYNAAGVGGGAYNAQAGSPAGNPAGYPFGANAAGYAGQNYAQFGGNPYAAQSVQTPQFGVGLSPASGGGAGSGAYGGGLNGASFGSGYPGYNGGAGSSAGHVGGWNTQHAGSPAGAAAWPAGSHLYTPGYAGAAAGNANNPSGSYGAGVVGSGGAAQFPLASGSALAQQAYPAAPAHAYQSPATNAYAQAGGTASTYSGSSALNTRLQPGANHPSRIRNSNLNYQHDSSSQDLRQSASTMGGSDYADAETNSYQQPHQQRRPNINNNNSNAYSSSSRSRFPSPSKKRPASKQRPTNNNNFNNHHQQFQHNGNGIIAQQSGGGNKHFLPTGAKKGSHFDSSVVDSLVVVDHHDHEYYIDAGGDDGYNDDHDSEEKRNSKTDPDDDEHRWRSKNPAGLRPHPIHNHNPNGRWKGTASKQAPSKNVRGNVGGSEGVHSQPGRVVAGGGSSKLNNRNKKGGGSSSSRPRSQAKKQQQQRRPQGKPTDEESSPPPHDHRGRVRQQQQKYESRDVYTTLPEYVFRVDERPDVFIRPGKWKSGGGGGALKGARHWSRIGETDGSPDEAEQKETRHKQDQGRRKKFRKGERDSPQEALEKHSADPIEGALFEAAPRGGEEEIIVSVSKAIDENARAGGLRSDNDNESSGFITSEELDPEEREAFVDEVYADYHHRRHDSDGEKDGQEEFDEEEDEQERGEVK